MGLHWCYVAGKSQTVNDGIIMACRFDMIKDMHSQYLLNHSIAEIEHIR